MRFTKTFLDEIRQRFLVSDVVSRRVKLKRQGKEFIGLSPFKVEKTPSFTVNDQKGFYHCFSTGEHGDIFTFLMKNEGLSFSEAVERLASEAGVPLPNPSGEFQTQTTDHKDRLFDIMEVAADFFEKQCFQSMGRHALQYVHRRGLSESNIRSFRLGYAPNGKDILKSYLLNQGFSIDEMIRSGLLIGGEDIPVPYDRFRNRVMFPITDLKGRVIAFGGRALAENQPAKYLNSPDTPLFHKGHVLFNAYKARQAAYDQGQIIVAEGYMDVIALSLAGFENAVAPLGTAVTEQQLKLLWRMADEPVLCFDGDTAGRKAANRVVETALPLLSPGKSIKFAYLPENQDPDDLIQSQGVQAITDVLKQGRVLFDVLWKKEVDATETDTPEKRALLEQRLSALVDTIKHEAIRKKYFKEVKQALYQLERKTLQTLHGYGGQQSQGSRRNNSQVDWHTRQRFFNHPKKRQNLLQQNFVASDELVSSSLLAGDVGSVSPRESLILLTLVNHLWLLDDYAEELAGLNFENKMLQKVLNSILEAYNLEKTLDRSAIHTHLSRLGYVDALNVIEQTITHKSYTFVQPQADEVDVEGGWRQLLIMHRKCLELKRDLEAAEQAYYLDISEENWNRLNSVRSELHNMEGLEADFSSVNFSKEAS